MFLNLARREARSRASESPKRLVSANWVLREILLLPKAAMAFSTSSIWRERSWFSAWSFFLEESASFKARAISSNFWLASTMRAEVSLPFLSWLALSLMPSSREARASWRSRSIPPLSFSALVFILLRLSIVSPISAMLLLCFCLKAAKVPSWATLDSSSWALSLAKLASLFLLSSMRVAVLLPESSSFSARSPISLDRVERFFSALALLERSMVNSSSSSSILCARSLIWLLYLLPKASSSSILADIEVTSFSFLVIVWASSLLILSKSFADSCVSLRSPSTFLLSFSTSPLFFFSLSSLSSVSSRSCSSLPLTLLRWLHLSSFAWTSSSVFWRESPTPRFSFWSLHTMVSWWTISSFKVLIWPSLVILSSSVASKEDSRVITSPLSLSASTSTLVFWALILAIASSSPRTLAKVSSNCFWRSFLTPSILSVLLIMSWTALLPPWRARTSSFFSFCNLSCSALTLLQSLTALPMWASARAIFAS